MPEGPEIRRAADRLSAAVAGHPLAAAWFHFPELKRHQRPLVGRRIVAIEPHGKALLTHFEHGLTLYSHNQLYGVWKIAPAGQRPDSARSLRVALETDTTAVLLYSASDVEMWKTDELAKHPFLSKLGPDVLDPGLKAAVVEKRLRDPRFLGRALVSLLLDQEFLAGMGNYLRSEVLFSAGIAPHRRPADLDAPERKRLAKALLDVPRASYRTRGIEPAAGMREDYLTDTPAGFRFRVFDREGEPCPACGDVVVRHELGGRRLYWCRTCQH